MYPPLLNDAGTNHVFVLPTTFSGPCNSFYSLGHSKNVYDDDDDDDDIHLHNRTGYAI